MNILIPTIGTRGDVQPFIALARGLIRAGHATTLASHPVMSPLVARHDVPFAPIGPDIDLSVKVAEIRRDARSVAAGLMRGMRFGFDMLERSHDDILALCRKADLVIVPTSVAAGKNEAELLGLPYASVSLMPWAIPWTDPERPWGKRVLYGAIDGMIGMVTTRPLNRIRRHLGLPPVGKQGFTSPHLNLIPISPAVYEPNPLWEARHQMTGYWFTETPATWSPSEGLLDYLADGEPPVLVSLGAMGLGDKDAAGIVHLFVAAAQHAGVRMIIQGWEAELRAMDLPDGVTCAGALPHSWLLPQCLGIVHHGGFGSTSAGLLAGIPAVVIPHMVDQFYWGQRVHELGVGPEPIRRSSLELERLVQALAALKQDRVMRDKARVIGEHIRAERGVDTAVHLLERTFV